MSLVELKEMVSVVVFITGGVGALLPWVLGEGAPGERFMEWGDTFAGGVLGGAGLIHLLSGGVGAFRAIAPGLNYPLAFVLAGAGFLLILLVESVVVADPDPMVSPLHCGSRGASHEIGPQSHAAESHPFTFILLLVLSVHSIIVGMALGAQSSLSRMLIVFAAIMAHKAMAGFALGVSYRRAGSSLRRTAPAVVFFSSMTPLGILAGTTIDSLVSFNGRQMFEAIFDSVGAGTFLYIATLDIIRTEFELPGDQWQKWLLASSGFGLMALLALWI
ncbi:MAG: ZIP family metal transporter [Deltaproteobacteria bacterium]|jgi:zinc transporter 1/2/3